MTRPVIIAVVILLVGVGFDMFWDPSRAANAGCNNKCRVRFFFKYCVGGGSTSGACTRFDEPVCHLCVNGQCTDVDWAKVEPCNL